MFRRGKRIRNIAALVSAIVNNEWIWFESSGKAYHSSFIKSWTVRTAMDNIAKKKLFIAEHNEKRSAI